MASILKDRHHRWLFANKDGQEISFPQKNMPFTIFKDNAEWGGSCEMGGIKCRIRIRHNSDGVKGRRLEVWFPHEELGKVVSYDESTLVGYVGIRGRFKDKTGKCFFIRKEESPKMEESDG